MPLRYALSLNKSNAGRDSLSVVRKAAVVFSGLSLYYVGEPRLGDIDYRLFAATQSEVP